MKDARQAERLFLEEQEEPRRPLAALQAAENCPPPGAPLPGAHGAVIDRSSERPSVSVIVPALNAEETIGKCIESLLDLDYSADAVEILVVDNGSTDRTREVTLGYPVKVLSATAHRSPAAARDRGIVESGGEILAFIDSDCVADPGWLAAASVHFADESVGAIGGRIMSDEPRCALERYVTRRQSLSNERVFRHLFMPAFLTANVVIRRAVFEQVGLFRPTWQSGEDIDLAWRMQAEGGRRLVYEPGARVLHQHRTTLGSFYRQRRRWALGAALLAEKWGPKGFVPRGSVGRSLAQLLLKSLLIPLTVPLAAFWPDVFCQQVVGAVARAADIAGRRAGRGAAGGAGVFAASQRLMTEEPSS